jgi:hypothetical protein
MILGPPSQIDDATLAFCATISPHAPFYVPVDPAPDTRVAYCFDNSEQQAARHGGEAAYGWAIWRWPGRWFEAEHHAVWRRPDGSLLDVTPQAGDPPRILFLPDPDAVYDPSTFRANVMAPDAGNPLARVQLLANGDIRLTPGGGARVLIDSDVEINRLRYSPSGGGPKQWLP